MLSSPLDAVVPGELFVNRTERRKQSPPPRPGAKSGAGTSGSPKALNVRQESCPPARKANSRQASAPEVGAPTASAGSTDTRGPIAVRTVPSSAARGWLNAGKWIWRTPTVPLCACNHPEILRFANVDNRQSGRPTGTPMYPNPFCHWVLRDSSGPGTAGQTRAPCGASPQSASGARRRVESYRSASLSTVEASAPRRCGVGA